MNDIQNILNAIFPFVERLLKEYGEFYPLSCAVNLNQEIEHILLEENEDDDCPASASVIDELKKVLYSRKDDFLAVAIFYDVELKEEETSAIAVFVEHKEEELAYTFYFPYELINNDLILGESWKVVNEREIFED
ncbi:hypothetical protein HNP37_003949 [Flavobacterium nitrogenifigens]|uniref:Uncharacterized protein n=2 Tax=Flavobacterium TaxID=237 RepID=A0A7W7N9V6_9FLAO|nr:MULTISPECIES: hypothetical protein [Flavobacterium]MBB4803869.1 hypothetical protein [Flavobacterium nitrogenifigens]MBB6388979.1 hypothetical protein [Flavobacterium notoginsengisoli]